MRALLLLALAGCPRPVEPATPPPAPPPPATVDDEPAAVATPKVLAVRGAGMSLELVRLDLETGDADVLHTIEGTDRSPTVHALVVDPESGRYAAAIEADAVDGDPTDAPRDVTSLILDGAGVIAGSRGCKAHRCFESSLWIEPGAETVVTATHRSGGSDLLRYRFGAGATPSALTGAIPGFPKKGVVDPVVSADHRRIAYAVGREVVIVDLPGTAREVGAAVADADLLFAGDALVRRRDDGTIEEVGGGVLHRAASHRDAPMFWAGDAVVTIDGAAVVAVPLDGGARTLADGVEALLDVSGRWLLTREAGALVLRDLEEDRVAARWTVPDRVRIAHPRVSQ